MIRVLNIDDHPALRAGLRTVLQLEPGLVHVGDVGSEEALWPALQRTKPDVVLLDYHLPGADGLQLCARITRQVLAPRVLVYSAYASPALTIPALLAGASGIVGKDAEARTLYEAIRRAARGERVLQPVTRPMLDEATARVPAEDAPLLVMAVDGCTPVEIATALRTEPEDVRRRLARMIGLLRVDAPTR